MKIQKLKEQRDKINKEIKALEYKEARENNFKAAQESVGRCYRFTNRYSGQSSKSWYIYAQIKEAVLTEDSYVYLIVDKYEIDCNGEITIRLNSREICSDVRPMHCWDNIRKEEFEKEKANILIKAMKITL